MIDQAEIASAASSPARTARYIATTTDSCCAGLQIQEHDQRQPQSWPGTAHESSSGISMDLGLVMLAKEGWTPIIRTRYSSRTVKITSGLSVETSSGTTGVCPDRSAEWISVPLAHS